MIRKTLLLLLILLFCAAPAAFAQDEDEAEVIPQGALEKPLGLNPQAPLSNEATEKIYKQCRSVMPLRFTPSALDYYCTCSAATTQALMTTGEYESIQKERNRVLSNQAYVKYVTQVIIPCMDTPTLDVEYFSCVLNRSNDPEIRNIVKYCECLSQKMSRRVQDFGDTDVMTKLDDRYNKDPMEALWNSNGYRQTRVQSMDHCRRGFLRAPKIYN